MNQQYDAAAVIVLCVSLVGVWMAVVAWRLYFLDRFRETLLSIRDELFLYAASGAIDFDDPVYGRLRQLLNTMLRFAHHVTFGEAFAIVLVNRLRSGSPPPTPHYDEWRRLLSAKPADVQATLLHLDHRVKIAIATQLLTSPPTIATTLAILVWKKLCGDMPDEPTTRDYSEVTTTVATKAPAIQEIAYDQDCLAPAA